jgi:lipopolysaccharide heptosyltransferase II
VRSVNWLGDAVMTTPALQRLRERFPQAKITLLTQNKLARLWDGLTCVDEVLTLGDSEGPLAVARRLRSENLDASLIFPNSPRSALETWLAGVPRRIGYGTPWRSWLLTEPLKHSPPRLLPRRLGARDVKRRINNPTSAKASGYEHQMLDYLRLAAALGSNPLPLPPKLHVSKSELEGALATVQALLASKKMDRTGQPLVWLGINASAAYGPAKCWPVERFAAAARQVAQTVSNCIWLSFGTEADRNVAEQLACLSGGTILNLAGKTSLRQLMALLKICRVLLTNDSGPMHVAAALGTPVVAPFGSTSPDLTAPGEPGDPRHHLLTGGAPCSPCFRRACPIDFRCMTAITVDQVVAAVLAALTRAMSDG